MTPNSTPRIRHEKFFTFFSYKDRQSQIFIPFCSTISRFQDIAHFYDFLIDSHVKLSMRHIFLALLDYGSKGYGMGICPSPLVRRPCRNYFRTYWQISFRLQLLFAPGHTPRLFCHDFFFVFVNIWDPMAAKASKRYSSSLESLLNFPNFS